MDTVESSTLAPAVQSVGLMDWLRNLLVRMLGLAAPPIESDRASDLAEEDEAPAQFVLAEGGYRIRVPHPSDVGHSVGEMLPSVKEGLALLPPLPVVVIELLREIQDPKSTASSVAEVASSDPSLAASLLRTSNSAALGLSRTITSVSEAVSYLGFGTVKAMVIRLRLDQVLTPKNETGAMDADDLWVHSLAVSYAAECMAREIGGVDIGFVATLGLMHDIGKLAALAQFPNEANKLRSTAADASQTWHEREAAAYGLDHAGLGANLAAKWKLPADLVQAIRWHHRPTTAFGPSDPLPLRKAVQIVQIANQLAKYCFPYADVMEIEKVSDDGFALVNLEPSLAKLLDKPVRDAISKAIFFAEGNTRMPSAAPRRFLRPLRGEAAAKAAASTAPPIVAEDSALVARLFSEEVPELFNNNGVKQGMAGLKHVRFSTSATAAGIQKCVVACKAHQNELGLHVDQRSIAAMTIKSLLANLQPLSTPTEKVEVAQMLEGRRLTLGVRTPGLASARRIGAPTDSMANRHLADADVINVLNLGWFEKVMINADGTGIVFVGK